jgi:hypothetical protein
MNLFLTIIYNNLCIKTLNLPDQTNAQPARIICSYCKKIQKFPHRVKIFL